MPPGGNKIHVTHESSQDLKHIFVLSLAWRPLTSACLQIFQLLTAAHPWVSPISLHVTCKEHARTRVQKTHWCHPGGVAKTTELCYFLMRLLNFFFYVLILQYFTKEWCSGLKHLWFYCTNVYIPYIQCRKRFDCHHVSDSTGFSLPAWWVSGRRWFWITSAVSVYSGFIPITKPPWHSAAYSLHHSPDNKWLTWWKPVHLLCWKCRNGCKYTPNFALDWGLFTERAADCPPTLPGLIELICACPAAHSARLKMQKDSRQRRGRTKKKKKKRGATGRVEGGKKWRQSWRKRQKEAGWEVNEAIRRNRELNDLVVAEKQTKIRGEGSRRSSYPFTLQLITEWMRLLS